MKTSDNQIKAAEEKYINFGLSGNDAGGKKAILINYLVSF